MTQETTMDIQRAMKQRHSVRSYTDRPIEGATLQALKEEIVACNRESGLHIQLVQQEPKAFDSFMAHYGKFNGVQNYLVLVGKKSPSLDETCGYYGERLVLKAQQLGLNTCWVAMTYRKVPGAFTVERGEKLTVVIAIGYGRTQGVAHKSKTAAEVSSQSGSAPEWFRAGVEAALLAPTAMNQQKFTLHYENGKVTAKAGRGFYTKLDLGIVRYHFECGSGKPHDIWND